MLIDGKTKYKMSSIVERVNFSILKYTMIFWKVKEQKSFLKFFISEIKPIEMKLSISLFGLFVSDFSQSLLDCMASLTKCFNIASV